MCSSLCCQCHARFLTSNIHKSTFDLSIYYERYGVINGYKCKQDILEFSEEFVFIQIVDGKAYGKIRQFATKQMFKDYFMPNLFRSQIYYLKIYSNGSKCNFYLLS